MTSVSLDHIANEILTLIEWNEARLLNWGFIHVESDLDGNGFNNLLSQMPDTVKQHWTKAQSEGIEPVDILENLKQRKLIFQMPSYRYRTRFAETLRLMYLLRQRFKQNDWQTAPRLVSDMRVELRRRQYPSRTVPLDDLLNKLEKEGVSVTEREIVEQLLHDPGGNPLQLAHFQQRAIVQQLRVANRKSISAFVIGAGTGAGKTKAFYTPTLASIATKLQNRNFYVQLLAIYPRTELLKDQLNEAVSEVLKLQAWLKDNGKRSIRIGAYYGDTPVEASIEQVERKKWQKASYASGYICPFIVCPQCSNQLIWQTADIQKNRTRLICQDCGYTLSDEMIVLTRKDMRDAPPDILFTTSEMLNRRLSNVRERPLFGIHSKPPGFLLLDEIHTYAGLSGAQVAYLLRRWQYAAGHRKNRQSLTIVGLSATLEQAEDFFAKLTGVPRHAVYYISPRNNQEALKTELVEEGAEYNIVLKGDSSNQTSLLSTSIQTTMLLSRMLDPDRENISHGVYQPRIFAFADKLDIINRWHIYLKDAENNKHLPALRDDKGISDSQLRQALHESGQIWQVAKRIGNRLDAAIRISRTTSGDKGVDPDARVVVASSTLEVGFNDPTVGAVMQHKAPRDMASFLQRKGRAGRKRITRPWTVVVTSGFGRDRWAFQNAEQLFSPVLPPNYLPIENDYIRKIQATYTIMEWLADKIKHSNFDGWLFFSKNPYKMRDELLHQVIHAIDAVLRDDAAYKQFSMYLEEALGIQDHPTALQTILWGEPRPLMLDVLPTLLRQIDTKWAEYQLGDNDQIRRIENQDVEWDPMPEYVPANLFSDLNLPEVILELPAGGEDTRTENLSLSQTLSEYAPTNINFRHNRLFNFSYWFPIPENHQEDKVDLDSLNGKFDFINKVDLENETYWLYRPLKLHLDKKPIEYSDSGRSKYIWKSKLEAGTLSEADSSSELRQPVLAPESPWTRSIHDIKLHLHQRNQWVQVTRSGTGFDATHYVGNVSVKIQKGFSCKPENNDNKEPAAIGYQINVDGIEIKTLPLIPGDLRSQSDWPEIYQSLAPAFFKYRLNEDMRLSSLSIFDIEDIWLLEMAMLTATAVARQISLQEASRIVDQKRQILIKRTLHTILSEQGLGDETDQISKRHKKLLEQNQDDLILQAVADHRSVLWDFPAGELDDWLTRTYQESIGAVFYHAICDLVPDIDPDQLILDIQADTIWITEQTAGGVGLLTRIATRLLQYPRELELQLADSLRHCERQYLANQLRGVAELVHQGDYQIETTFQNIRDTNDIISLSATKKDLTQVLQSNGIPTTRQLLVSLNSKFLRPNSSNDSDQLLVNLINHWEEEQKRLGITIDLRVFAVAVLQQDLIAEQLNELINRIDKTQQISENQRFNLLQSMLWTSCEDSCPECIEYYNPYQQLTFIPSRRLLSTWLYRDTIYVDYNDMDFVDQIREELESAHQIIIRCLQSELEDCQKSLFTVLTTPVENGFQVFYPIIERIERDQNNYLIYLIIRELVDI